MKTRPLSYWLFPKVSKAKIRKALVEYLKKNGTIGIVIVRKFLHSRGFINLSEADDETCQILYKLIK